MHKIFVSPGKKKIQNIFVLNPFLFLCAIVISIFLIIFSDTCTAMNDDDVRKMDNHICTSIIKYHLK